MKWIVVLLLLEACILRFCNADCAINTKNGFGIPTPLLLRPGTANVYPFSDRGTVNVGANQNIELYCTEGFNINGRNELLRRNSLMAQCVDGTNFIVEGKESAISSIKCTSWPEFTATRTGTRCNGGQFINVGFQLDRSRYLHQYQVCFNDAEEVPRYVHYTLHPGSKHYTNTGRIDFIPMQFNGKSFEQVDGLYKASQRTITNLLGNSKLFRENSLTRGHLAAKSDFVYGPQQRATFLFINAAPQWETFNNRNWQRVENDVLELIAARKISVECWTGVWGVSTLPNAQGVQTPLYLDIANSRMPVPQLYFRVVVQRATRPGENDKGIVLIGVNNPHKTQTPQEYQICTDVSDQINWLKWTKTSRNSGYSYACRVAEFRTIVTNLPDELRANMDLLV